ncbi:MAG: AAA family ATPase [Deltaproteobacteria bacterium]|nr:AAA family ATPase [Candidatus Zymogenaceae bacterium]
MKEIDTGYKKRHILITGSPGVGKTTLIASIVVRLPGTKTGFITREIRKGGVRKGFIIETLDGERASLAQVTPFGSPRVGKYRVISESIRRVGVPAIGGRADFIVIDEIGKIEGTPEGFIRAVHKVLAGPSTVIATIAGNGNSFIEEIKLRPDVQLFKMTLRNRDSLAEDILKKISASMADDDGWANRR